MELKINATAMGYIDPPAILLTYPHIIFILPHEISISRHVFIDIHHLPQHRFTIAINHFY